MRQRLALLLGRRSATLMGFMMRSLLLLGALLVALQVQLGYSQVPPAQYVEHLALSTVAQPLDNVTLRQAIASAIDRQAVFDAAKSKLPTGWSAAGPAGSWFPPILPQHSADIRIHPYNPAAAKSLLGQAGTPNGSGLAELELIYAQNSPWRQAEAEVVRGQLAAVGIRAKVTGLPAKAFFERVLPGSGTSGQYQLAIFALGGPPEKGKDDFLGHMFLPNGPGNAYGYRNTDVTLLIANIVKETDSAKRLTMLRDAEKLILTDAPVVPLLYFYMPP